MQNQNEGISMLLKLRERERENIERRHFRNVPNTSLAMIN